MEAKKLYLKGAFALLLSAFVVSCDREERDLTPRDSRDVAEEAVIDAYYQDMDDLAAVAITAPDDDDFAGGRRSATITINDSRFNCAGIVVTIEPAEISSLEHPVGVITVDFGPGCADLQGNIRSGKLLFYYDGLRFLPGSTLQTTTENYKINGIKLEGTRTLTNISGSTEDAPKFNVILVDGKATFQDGSAALRESDITFSWIREANPLNDKLIIHTASSATGTTRGGRSYEVTLSKQLEYKRFCPMAVSGTKTYTIDHAKDITIDYGSGECDRTFSVTVDGITRTIEVD